MPFNLTPLIIISRTSRFSLSSCPSWDKHNLFAIEPNKYVCVGDGTTRESGSDRERAPLPAPAGRRGPAVCPSAPGPVGATASDPGPGAQISK